MTPEQAGWAFITVFFYLLAEAFYWMNVASERGTRRIEMHVHSVLRSRTPDGSALVDSATHPQRALSTRAGGEAPEIEASVEPHPVRPYLAGASLPHRAAPARYPHTSVDAAEPRTSRPPALTPPPPHNPRRAHAATPQAASAPAGPNPPQVA